MGLAMDTYGRLAPLIEIFSLFPRLSPEVGDWSTLEVAARVVGKKEREVDHGPQVRHILSISVPHLKEVALMPEGEFQGASIGIKVTVVTHKHSTLHLVTIECTCRV